MLSIRGLRRLPTPPALRYPAFRAFWLGSAASVTGYQILIVAEGWLVYELTDSPLFLGYIGLVSAVPTIVFTLFGGIFADRLDKRVLLAATEVASAGLVILLGTLTLLDVVMVWHVLAIAFVGGVVWAFAGPAYEALYPRLVDKSALGSAVALETSAWNGSRIFAPLVAGLIIERVNMAAAFYVASAGMLIMAALVYTLRIPSTKGLGEGNPLRELGEVVSFMKGNSVVAFLIAMSFFTSFFGMSYVTLMPVFTRDILEVGADGQGILFMFGGIGALATSLYMSAGTTISRRALFLIGGACMSGLMLVAFALTSKYSGNFPLAIGLMFAMGVFNSLYLNTIITSLQILVPDEKRGRIMGTYSLTWSLMPLGGAQAGAIANVIGAPFALMIGGLAVSAFALGPCLLNTGIRNLGRLVRRAELAASSA